MGPVRGFRARAQLATEQLLRKKSSHTRARSFMFHYHGLRLSQLSVWGNPAMRNQRLSENPEIPLKFEHGAEI
jgi:hypothetical protein